MIFATPATAGVALLERVFTLFAMPLVAVALTMVVAVVGRQSVMSSNS